MFCFARPNVPAARFLALALAGLCSTAALAQSTGNPVAVPDSALGPASGRPPSPGPATAPAAAPAPAPSTAPLAPSSASTSVPIPVIMVVDLEGVVGDSKAYKSIQGQLEGLRQQAEKEIGQKKTDLETAEQDFQRDARSGAVPADQIEDKRHGLAMRQDQLQKEAEARREQLRQAYGNAMEKVKQALLDIIQGLAVERRANLVLYRSAAMPLDRSFEVSKEALTRLDQKLSSVTVTMPSAPAASAPASATPASTAPAAPKKK